LKNDNKQTGTSKTTEEEEKKTHGISVNTSLTLELYKSSSYWSSSQLTEANDVAMMWRWSDVVVPTQTLVSFEK
jgi:hypothetical protein